MNNNPDSALKILQKHSARDYTTSPEKAKYALLLTQAQDKNYVLHTSDSLIRMAVRYYDSVGDVESQAKAHYYLGRTYQDKDDLVGTVREFLTATPLAEKAGNYDMICMLKSNLGYLLWSNGLFDEADSLYQQAAQLEFMHHDAYRLSVSLLKRADIAMQKQKPNYKQAEKYLNQAFSLTKKFNNVIIKELLISDMSFLCEHTNRPQEAIEYARRGISLLSDSSQVYSYYLIMGNAYADMERYDSACIYLNRSLLTNVCNTKGDAYMRLARIAGKIGNPKEALNYYNQYIAYKDSAHQQERPVEVISSVKDMLNKQSAAHYESFLYRYRLFLYTSIALLALIIFFFVYKHKKKNREIEELQVEKQEQLYLKDNMEELLNSQRQKERELEEELKMKTSTKLSEIIKSVPIYNLLLEIRDYNKEYPDKKKKLTEENWNELSIAIDHIVPDYTEKLYSEYERLTKSDIHYCCLIRLDFSYSDISCILGCSKQAVYKRRNSIMDRMEIRENREFHEIIKGI